MKDPVQHPVAKGFHVVGASTYAIATAFIRAMDLPVDVKFADDVFEEIDNTARVSPMNDRLMSHNSDAAVTMANRSAITIVTVVEDCVQHTPSTIIDRVRNTFSGFPANLVLLSQSYWVEDMSWKAPEGERRKMARFIDVRTANGHHRDAVILDVREYKVTKEK